MPALLDPLRTPLQPGYVDRPMPPVLLPPSRALTTAAPIAAALPLTEVPLAPDLPAARAKLAQADVPPLVRRLLAEGLRHAARITRGAAIDELTGDFRNQIAAYGEKPAYISGGVGIHCDFPHENLLKRRLHLIVGAPYSTLTFPEVKPCSAKPYGWVGNMDFAPGEENYRVGTPLLPPPGRWMALQEGTPHTTPDLSGLTGRDDAARAFGADSPWLPYFREDGYTRLTVSLIVIFDPQPVRAPRPVRRAGRPATAVPDLR